MSGLRYLGGLMSGVGTGMVSQAEQKRQAALEAAREARRERERQEDRGWQKEDKAEDRTYQAERDDANKTFQLERDKNQNTAQRGLAKDQHKWREESARKERGHKANLDEIAEMDKQEAEQQKRGLFAPLRGTDAEGNTVDVNEYGEQRVTKGLTATGKGGADADPADIRKSKVLASWLARSEGRDPTDKDYVDAFEKVKMLGTDPMARAKMIADLVKASSGNMGDRRSIAEQQREATEFVDSLINQSQQAPKPAQSSSAKAPWERQW